MGTHRVPAFSAQLHSRAEPYPSIHARAAMAPARLDGQRLFSNTGREYVGGAVGDLPRPSARDLVYESEGHPGLHEPRPTSGRRGGTRIVGAEPEHRLHAPRLVVRAQ